MILTKIQLYSIKIHEKHVKFESINCIKFCHLQGKDDKIQKNIPKISGCVLKSTRAKIQNIYQYSLHFKI